jgi:hypothetical protein
MFFSPSSVALPYLHLSPFFFSHYVYLEAVLVERADVRYEVHAALTLLLLELERDALYGPAGNALHQVLRNKRII